MCAREESLVPKMDILKEHRKRPSHAVLADRLGMFDLRGSCGASQRQRHPYRRVQPSSRCRSIRDGGYSLALREREVSV